MKDKNGIEMKTGDIVEVSGAYFKCDNGLYYIDNSPNDEGWSGSDYCLHRITKKGKISKTNKICFWPIFSCVSDRFKTFEARDYNRENAVIEVKTDIDRSDVKKVFEEKAENQDVYIKRFKYDFGEESNEYKTEVKLQKFYQAVAASI